MRSAISFLVWSVLAAAPAAAGQRLLTEDESLRLALARAEAVQLRQGLVGAAEADAVEAGLWPNPTLEYVQERVGADPRATEQILHLSQSVDLAGRRALKRDAAQRRVAAAVADTDSRQADDMAEVRRRFHETLLRHRQLQALEQWAAHFAEAERIVTALQRAGDVSGYDRRRLSRERQAVQARVESARGDFDRAWERLLAQLGGAAAGDFDGVSGTLPPAAPPPLETVLEAARRRPELRALEERAAAFDLDGNAASRAWMPDVTLGVGPKRVDDGFRSDNGIVFSVAIPLPVFDRQQAGQARAAAQAAAARAEYGLALARSDGEVRGLHKQVLRLIAAAADFRDRSVAPSAELTHIAETAYRAGEGGILELLDAYKGALEAETTALDLEWSARQARIELDQISGGTAP